MVTFIPESHTYINEDGVIYTSGTTLVGLVKPKFHKEYFSLYKSIQDFLGFPNETEEDKAKFSVYMKETYNLKSYKKDSLALIGIAKRIGFDNYEKEMLLKQAAWEEKALESTDKGTAIHLLKENDAFEVGEKWFDSKIKGITQRVKEYPENLYDLPDGFYPEMLLWNDEEEIAGQSDCVWITTEGGVRYVDMDDYKSNKEINTQSRFKLLAPCTHLEDCHLNHYALQESFYFWMLEKFGFVPRYSRITHIPDGVTETHYGTKYLKRDVENILHYRRNNLFKKTK